MHQKSVKQLKTKSRKGAKIMKTFNGKSISKKAIGNVLRTMDATKIYNLYRQVTGEKPDHNKVWRFIEEYAPTKRIKKRAYWFCMGIRNKHEMERIKVDDYNFHNGRRNVFQRAYIVDYLKKQCLNPESNYAKRPMLGFTGLYFCSPAYGHSDYNKWRACDIKGNEDFCEAVIRYANKYFGNC